MRWRGVGRIAIRRSGGGRSCFRVKPSFMIAWQWTYTRTRSKLERVAVLVEIRAQRVRNRSMRYSYMLGVGGAFGGECSHLPCPVSTPRLLHALTHPTAEPGLVRIPRRGLGPMASAMSCGDPPRISERQIAAQRRPAEYAAGTRSARESAISVSSSLARSG